MDKKHKEEAMKSEAYIKMRNLAHPGFGACSRCGGNWGWKKHKDHMTSESSGLFLFCEECDGIVTPEERWKALDAWKKDCIKQVLGGRDSLLDLMKYISDLENTEFIEFPRPKKRQLKNGQKI